MDKKLFTAESVIGLKNPEKSFPLNNDVGVLKWRLQTTDESLIPLTSKCPPVRDHGAALICHMTGESVSHWTVKHSKLLSWT